MKLLVVSGGRHPYEESTPVLNEFLKAAGHDVTITEDASVLADATQMSGYDALVFNTRRENIPDFGDWALTPAEQQGMADYIKGGKGFVCLHISTCLASQWPEFHDITGGGWISGQSFHPPYGKFTVNVSHQFFIRNVAHVSSRILVRTRILTWEGYPFHNQPAHVGFAGDAPDGS